MAAGHDARAATKADEPTMDDILRSIRTILDEGSNDRADFSLPDGVNAANDFEKPAPESEPERPAGPPLAFLRRKTAEPIAKSEAETSSEPKSDASSRMTLEERLERHRQKAEAEKVALRRLSARAAARDRAVEDADPEKGEAPAKPAAEPPQTPEAANVDSRVLIDRFETAFAASDDLFEPVTLPEIEAQHVSYAPTPAQTSKPLPPSAAPVPATSPADLAKALLDERGTEINQALAGMLRTMVRDWLDDNLSTVVEKVVREEIERVSRGKR